jgi:hypothetical protein
MKVEEFFRYLADADFENLVGGRRDEFDQFVQDRISEGRLRVVLRILMEMDVGTGIPIPYYLWGVYSLDPTKNNDNVLEIYVPDYSEWNMYLKAPEELENEPYFEIEITAVS